MDKFNYLQKSKYADSNAYPGLSSLCRRTALYRIAMVDALARAIAEPCTIKTRTNVIVPYVNVLLGGLV